MHDMFQVLLWNMSLAHVAFYSIAACLVCKWLLYHCKWKFSIDNIPWSTTLRVKITSPRNNPAKGEEVFIAVMGECISLIQKMEQLNFSGVTGSGKSTFIRQVTGDLSCGAGHSLESGSFRIALRLLLRLTDHERLWKSVNTDVTIRAKLMCS